MIFGKTNVKTKTRMVFKKATDQSTVFPATCILVWKHTNYIAKCLLQCAFKTTKQNCNACSGFPFQFQKLLKLLCNILDFVSGCYEKWLWTYCKTGSG